MDAPVRSWGGYPRVRQEVLPLSRRDAALPAGNGTLLAHGNGRSYGDVCLNAGGTLLHTRGLDRFIAFDPDAGVLRCEAGVLLGEILDLIVPHGWFLPVLPGTQFVTVGGAIANDVHGKNHHRVGSFGHHVLRLELLRSDGQRLECSPHEHAALFAATVGGLGLTGLVTWAELRLQRVSSPWLQAETLPFRGLEEFLALSAASAASHDHTVAWIDCTARGAAPGLFFRANAQPATRAEPRRRRWSVPFTPPLSLVNRPGVRLFNTVYRAVHAQRRAPRLCHYRPYFFPLDAVTHWNRIYGPRGFLQHQCVIPTDVAPQALAEILQRVARDGGGSFLAVLKQFGDQSAPGLLSFARPGITLALDFPLHGATTLRLLDTLDRVVADAGGAVYPAKDARMAGADFRRFFPAWESMHAHIDPRFSSSFWRRVTEDA